MNIHPENKDSLPLNLLVGSNSPPANPNGYNGSPLAAFKMDDLDALLKNQQRELELITDTGFFKAAPDTLSVAEDAFALLGYVLKRWNPPVRLIQYKDGKKVVTGEKPQDDDTFANDLDRCLAHFIEEHPGELEALLLSPERQQQMAHTQTDKDAQARKAGRISGGLPESVLNMFLDKASPDEGELLWRTIRSLELTALVRAILMCLAQYNRLLRWDSTSSLLYALVKWKGVEAFPALRESMSSLAPAERLDALELAVRQHALHISRDGGDSSGEQLRLPDILPSDEAVLCTWSADDIATHIADYRGVTVAQLHQMLVAQRFLHSGEHIGEIILQDARTLSTLGVSRYALAEALQNAMLLGLEQYLYLLKAKQHSASMRRRLKEAFGGKPPFKVEYMAFRGHHQDPFHSDDTYYISSEVRGSADCTIASKKTKEFIYFSDMHPYLIRRACFFQGSVCYRLDPAKACRVLGIGTGGR